MEKVICVNAPEHHEIRASLDLIVKDFRQIVSEECGILIDQQILIYNGQIMVDHRTLQSYDLEDSICVHCLQFEEAGKLNDLLMRLDLSYARLETSGDEKLVNSSYDVCFLYMTNCETRGICDRNITRLSRELYDRERRKFPQSSSSSLSGTVDELLGVVNVKDSKSSYSVAIDLYAHVIILKTLLKMNYDIPSSIQILVYKGSVMVNYRTLKSYGLEAATDSIHLLEFVDADVVNANLQRMDLYSHELEDSEIKHSVPGNSLDDLNKLYTERLGICINNIGVLNKIVARWQYQYGGTNGDLLQMSFNLLREKFPVSGNLGQCLFNIVQEEKGSTNTSQNTTSQLSASVRNIEAAAKELQNGGTSGSLARRGQRFYNFVKEKHVAELSKLQQMGFYDTHANTVSLMFAIVRILDAEIGGLQ